MTIEVAPSTYHTLKFISENPGCTSREFCDHFGRDLCHIRSPYYSNMLSLDIEGSQPHPRSPLGRLISWTIRRIHEVNTVPTHHDGYIPDLEKLIKRGRGRRNWIYRSKTNSKVFRYYITNKGMAIVDQLEEVP